MNRSVNRLTGLLEIAHLIPNPTGNTNSTAKIAKKDQSSQERLDSANKTFNVANANHIQLVEMPVVQQESQISSRPQNQSIDIKFGSVKKSGMLGDNNQTPISINTAYGQNMSN
jgi:sortase (surface protein transpeptidase)